jgi:hypothetical protein
MVILSSKPAGRRRSQDENCVFGKKPTGYSSWERRRLAGMDKRIAVDKANPAELLPNNQGFLGCIDGYPFVEAGGTPALPGRKLCSWKNPTGYSSWKRRRLAGMDKRIAVDKVNRAELLPNNQGFLGCIDGYPFVEAGGTPARPGRKRVNSTYGLSGAIPLSHCEKMECNT